MQQAPAQRRLTVCLNRGERMDAIGFSTTREMHDWIYSTRILGPCVVLDKWTYGLVEVEGNPATGKWMSWRTINREVTV